MARRSYDQSIYTTRGKPRQKAKPGSHWFEPNFNSRQLLPCRLPPKDEFKKSAPLEMKETFLLPKVSKIPDLINAMDLSEIRALDRELKLGVWWYLDRDFKTNNVRFARKIMIELISNHAEAMAKSFRGLTDLNPKKDRLFGSLLRPNI